MRARWVVSGLLGLLAALAPDRCGALAAVGDVVDDAELPVAGAAAKRHFLGGKGAKATLYVFLDPEQERTRSVVRDLAALESELAARPVHIALLVSDRAPVAAIEALVKSGPLKSPVLIDGGDVLYSRLGGMQHPVAGVVDASRRLRAHLSYRRINWAPVLSANVRRVLGEIDDAQLAAETDPGVAEVKGDAVVARRFLKTAQMLLRIKSWDKAADNARQAIAKDPSLAPAHTTLGLALAGLGRCAEALPVFDKAISLEPGGAASAAAAAAVEGRRSCATPGAR